MSEQLTFLHTADLHLGAPFRGLRALSESWAQRLLYAIPEAYDRVIDTALNRAVDFVVISGDIFDTSRPAYGDYLHFFDGLRRLGKEGIEVYLCLGNHDPYTSWHKDFDSLPTNAHLFGAAKPTFELYQRNGQPLCLLGGRSYYNQTWPSDEDISEGISRKTLEAALLQKDANVAAAPFSVGVIHTGLHLDLKKAPVDPAALLARGIDYWACGHVHRRCAFPSSVDPRIVFPGCIQGRDIRETGERGCTIVTLTEGASNELEFVPTASVVWEQAQVDVGECRTITDIQERIITELFRLNGHAQCGEMCVRVTLTGASELHKLLNSESVIEDLRQALNESYPEFFCDAIVNETCACRDREALAREGLFPATLMRVAREELLRSDEAVAFIQDELMKRGVSAPSSLASRISEYTRDAENLALDLIARDEQ